MSEPTYKCPLCLDGGTVSVIDPRFFRVGLWKECAVPCKCEAGIRFSKPSREGAKWRARYYAPIMFPVPEGTTSRAKAQFLVWLDDPQRKLDAINSAAKTLSNYEPGFDRYNAEATQTELGF